MVARWLDVTPDEYHVLPGFHSTLAVTLLQRSPMHAKHEQDGQGKEATWRMDRGTVGHALLLGRGKRFAPCPFDDWRTKAAKETRDNYRKAGLVPVLSEQLGECQKMAEAHRANLKRIGIVLDGEAEAAIAWTDNGVECRGMLDHMKGEWIDDVKIVEDASPSRMERSAESMGYAIQCAAYTRARVALDPSLAGRVRFRFLFCEATPPYAVHCPEPDGVFRELGEQRWLRALASWAKCEREQRWPGYEDNRYITAPQWALRQEGFTSDEL